MRKKRRQCKKRPIRVYAQVRMTNEENTNKKYYFKMLQLRLLQKNIKKEIFQETRGASRAFSIYVLLFEKKKHLQGDVSAGSKQGVFFPLFILFFFEKKGYPKGDVSAGGKQGVLVLF